MFKNLNFNDHYLGDHTVFDSMLRYLSANTNGVCLPNTEHNLTVLASPTPIGAPPPVCLGTLFSGNSEDESLLVWKYHTDEQNFVTVLTTTTQFVGD
jgi:hypothetical protein